jgi:hypothetical protein
MKSAEARLLRASASLPGKLQPTSPLPSQSKSGPTSSLSSAMNPSKDTAATPMIVLPMFVLPSHCSCSRRAAVRLRRHLQAVGPTLSLRAPLRRSPLHSALPMRAGVSGLFT